MTQKSGGIWSDLAPRLVTSIALLALGIAGIYLGGLWFAVMVALVVGVIAWELSMMAQSTHPQLVALVSGLCSISVMLLPPGWGLPLLMLPVLASQAGLRRVRLAHALFLLMAMLAGYGLVDLRGLASPGWLIWLVAVVAITDIAGYFAGRLIGGPKIWPRVSPKKTWSGTAAGWVAAALVGYVVYSSGGMGLEIVPISVAVSMASQLGDVAESAFKRRVGVKDSSTLLPGHGGFFDRFDGVLGASVFLLLVEQVIDFPPIAV